MNANILLNRPAIRGHELRKGIEAFAHHICSGLRLRPVSIQWVEISTAASNDGGDMFLASVRDDALIKRADVLRYLGFVVHELLHRRYTDFSVNARSDEPSILRTLHNAVEDAWIERSAIKSGLLGNIETLLTGLLREMTDRARAEVTDWTDPAIYPFALAVTARAYPGVTVPLAAGLAPIFSEAERRIDGCQSSTDTLDVARWVLSQLQSLPQPEPQPEPQQEPGQDPGQDPGQEPGQDPGQDPGQEPGHQPGDQPGDQSGDGQGEGQPGDGDQPGDGQEPGEGKGEGQGKGQGNAPGEAQPGPARPMTGNETAREVEPRIDTPEGASGGGSWSARAETRRPGAHLGKASAMTVEPVSSPRLEHEVRRLFEDSGSTLFTLNRRAGSVNVNALARVGTTDRLFKQRRDVEGIDSAVVIVLDISGSMFMRPARIAAALSTCDLLHRVLSRAGVAVSVVTFGDTASVSVPWGTPTAKAREILSRLRSDDNTNDHAALRVAHDMLLARPEARKVCFSITDGNGSVSLSRNQVEAGENLGIVTIGLGMQLDVSQVYPRNIRVQDLDALATASLRQIKIAA